MKKTLFFITLGAVLSLLGCAALKVDVDVYKGSFANSEDVQTEQMAVMAIGAKPLLVRLKDELKNDGYAERVKAILSLYSNRLPEDIIKFKADMDNALERYRLNRDIFSDSGYSKLWLEMEDKAKDSSSKNMSLHDGYKDFFKCSLQSEWTWNKTITKEHNKHSQFENIPDDNINAVLDALKRKNVVSIHADMLFGKEPDKIKVRFVSNVNKRAEAFLEMRTALHDLMVIALKALGTKNAWGQYLLDDYGEAKKAVINLVVGLIQPKNLKVALVTANADLLKRFQEFPKFGNKQEYVKSSAEDFRRFLKEYFANEKDLQKFVATLIDLDKRFVRDEISDISELEKISNPSVSNAESYRNKSKRRYGIAIGPNDLTDTVISRALPQVVESIYENLTGPLNRGRMDEGLETLIERYLGSRVGLNADCAASIKNGNKCSRADLPECDHLIDALVDFAEKVRLMANYEILLATKEDMNDVKPYITVLQAVSNSILSMADDHRQRSDYKLGLKKRWAAELAALKSTYSRNASSVLGLVVEQLRVERDLPVTIVIDDLDVLAKNSLLEGLKNDIITAQQSLIKLRAQFTQANLSEAKVLIGEFNGKIKKVLPGNDDSKNIQYEQKHIESFIANDFKKELDLNTAIARVVEYKKTWAANKGAFAVNAVALKDELIAQMDDDFSVNNDLNLKKTMEILRVRKFNIASIGEIDDLDKSDKDPRQVLEQLISTLRYQYIQELQANGENTTTAKNIISAIDAASQHRSSMIFLRPSGAFLRNSYPITTLQDDPGTSWNNMLEKQGFKAFFPVFYSFNNRTDEGKMKAEIDKQFWQNINSVRLAGGGRTNYVIAKDDIGNWYVKAYAAEPKDIIKSAKNLALFSLGPKLKANMGKYMKSGEKQTDKAPDEQGETKKVEEEPSVIEQLFNKYEAQYAEQTSNDKGELANILNTGNPSNKRGLNSLLNTAWASNEDNNKLEITDAAGTKKVFLAELSAKLASTASEILKPAYEELIKEADKDKKAGKSDGNKIITALNDVKRFHIVLVQRIKDLHVAYKNEYEKAKADLEKNKTALTDYKENNEPELNKLKDAKNSSEETEKTKLNALISAEHAEKAAVREAANVVRTILTEFTRKRKDSVNQYKTAIMFIGDITTQ